jgi:hypothetical protein
MNRWNYFFLIVKVYLLPFVYVEGSFNTSAEIEKQLFIDFHLAAGDFNLVHVFFDSNLNI